MNRSSGGSIPMFEIVKKYGGHFKAVGVNL